MSKKMARNPKSIGEMISTVTFFGVALACILQAVDFHEAQQLVRSYISSFAGLLCIMGGLRFVISDIVSKFYKRIRK